jgi:hypothetical protein
MTSANKRKEGWVMKKALDLLRVFASALQEDKMVAEYITSKRIVDSDEALQQKICEWQEAETTLKHEPIEGSRLKELQAIAQGLYDEIISNTNMQKLNDAKLHVDKFVRTANLVLVKSIEGEDPYSIDPDDYHSCGSGCGECGCCGR